VVAEESVEEHREPEKRSQLMEARRRLA